MKYGQIYVGLAQQNGFDPTFFAQFAEVLCKRHSKLL
jgi:hypothetical protein